MNAIPASQLLDQLHWRYATKKFDPTRKISAADWAALEDVLVLAPSSGGLQPWKFVVVEDAELRARLLPVSFGQTQVVEASHLVVLATKKDFTLADVDAHIARTAEVRGMTTEALAGFRGMLAGGVEAKDAAALEAWTGRQTGIALGFLLASAAVLGIDACPMEGFVPAEYDAILGLGDEGFTTVAICPMGYRSADDPYATLPKVRFPKERVLVRR